MVVTPFRLSRAMRRELDELYPTLGLPDRSALVRRFLADGIRRAHAGRTAPAPALPDEPRAPAPPPAPRAPHPEDPHG